MHYLIDGHNLIAQIPEISLEDPDDEAKLVISLRSWVAAGRNRHVTVIFDGGLPGGMWHRISTRRIKAVFAPADSSADALLIKRVNAVRDVAAYTLVSSDQAVLSTAKNRRMPYITSERFAESLSEHRESLEISSDNQSEIGELERSLSEEEIADWLQVFDVNETDQPGKHEENPIKQAISPTLTGNDQPGVSPKSKPSGSRIDDPALAKSGDRVLDEAELSEWMEIFGKPGEKTQ